MSQDFGQKIVKLAASTVSFLWNTLEFSVPLLGNKKCAARECGSETAWSEICEESLVHSLSDFVLCVNNGQGHQGQRREPEEKTKSSKAMPKVSRGWGCSRRLCVEKFWLLFDQPKCKKSRCYQLRSGHHWWWICNGNCCLGRGRKFHKIVCMRSYFYDIEVNA